MGTLTVCVHREVMVITGHGTHYANTGLSDASGYGRVKLSCRKKAVIPETL